MCFYFRCTHVWYVCALVVFIVACRSSHGTRKQSTAKVVGDEVIAYVGDEPIYASEFRFAYEKNLTDTDSAYTLAHLKNYLDLYLNFKMKVLYARQQGIDTTEAFLREFRTYEEQLARPYLRDQRTIDSLAKQAYARMQEEISASHILVALPEDATPQDTLKAYERLMRIREEIVVQGADFGTMARRYSDDPSATSNKGYLGYFTALQMVYPFENMAYSTPVGEVSPIFRTQYGYHILKVHDRRPNSGKVQVAHIMLRVPKGGSEIDSMKVVARIQDIYRRLQAGEDWNTLCRQYSEDINSKNKGGELPAFSVGSTLPEFEEVAFSLREPGQISEPFATAYGWHIIRLIRRQAVEPYEVLEDFIKRKVSRDSRSRVSEAMLYKRLRAENQLQIQRRTLQQLSAYIDSSLLVAQWQPSAVPAALQKKELFRLSHPKVSQVALYLVRDFIDYVVRKQQPQKFYTPSGYFEVLFERYVDEQVLAFERAHLAEKYPEYGHLLREYREGMLLFQVMTEKVWRRAIDDTLGIRLYWQAHQDRYRFPDRLHALILSASDASDLQKAVRLIESGKGGYPVSEPIVLEYAFKQTQLSRDMLPVLDRAVSLLLSDEKLYAEISAYQDSKEPSGTARQRLDALLQYAQRREIETSRIQQKVYVYESRSRRQHPYFVRIQVFSSDASALASLIPGIEVREGAFAWEQEAVLQQLPQQEGVYNFRLDDKHYHVRIHRIEAARPKTFLEARGEVIADYQRYLEEEWLEQLRSVYPVRVIEENLLHLSKTKS